MPKEKALAGRRAQRHERAIPSEGTMSTKTWKQMITIMKELNMTLGGDRGQGTATQDTERETEWVARSAAESRIKGRGCDGDRAWKWIHT